MDLSNIYELWDRFDRSDVVEMELDMNGTHFHLKSSAFTEGSEAIPVSKTSGNISDVVKSTSDITMRGDLKAENEDTFGHTEADSQKKDRDLKTVKAPLVGTFYLASSPDADPYVKVGQEIHKGDVIGIVEAMKLMNEVVADIDGKVVDILVGDGMMVEYDQPLITLE